MKYKSGDKAIFMGGIQYFEDIEPVKTFLDNKPIRFSKIEYQEDDFIFDAEIEGIEGKWRFCSDDFIKVENSPCERTLDKWFFFEKFVGIYESLQEAVREAEGPNISLEELQNMGAIELLELLGINDVGFTYKGH